MTTINLDTFRSLAATGVPIPLTRTLMSDQLTPVLAYRRLVAPDERTAPSFLFESVENGDQVGRHSFLGAQPSLEVWAYEHEVTTLNHQTGHQTTIHEENPLEVMRRLTPVGWASPTSSSMPSFGGWIGYAGYDTVRYLEPGKLPFAKAPRDDRQLPDLHFGLYPQVAVFDHVAKTITAVHWVFPDKDKSVDISWQEGNAALEKFVERLENPGVPGGPMPAGRIEMDLTKSPETPSISAGNQAKFEESVQICRNFISAGDIFQVVLSQRFERKTSADPFEIYRALRIVNPSPYMIYLQAKRSILVASSPEILCRVETDGDNLPIVTNRPLAGTRRRGSTPAEDLALEAELRADPKEKAEHVMLVDLGRNDLGRVCKQSSIQLEAIMEVERYSHVMHLSSTLTGRLNPNLDAWDALRHTLPVGTVSGAPKVRAMQIIDELEPTRRGPYGGGIGFIGLDGSMDIALALRTMVINTGKVADQDTPWMVHLQAGAGVVADSDPRKEYEETVHKAAALGRAIDLAESAFTPRK